MSTYYFYFSLFVIAANFGWAFGQLGKGKKEIFSLPLLLVTLGVSVGCLVWIHKRLAAVQKKKATNHTPEPTAGRR